MGSLVRPKGNLTSRFPPFLLTNLQRLVLQTQSRSFPLSKIHSRSCCAVDIRSSLLFFPIMLFILASLFLPLTLATPTVTVAKRGQICGVNGHNLGTSAYKVLSDASLANVNGCGASCWGSSQCQSFAIGSGVCMLYTPGV